MNRFGWLRGAAIAAVVALGIGAAPLADTASASAVADVAAPVLVSASVDRTSFSLGDGAATFTVSVKVTDASGVVAPFVSSSHASGQSAGFGALTLVSGTAKNGTWQRSITIPKTAAPGAWSVSLYPLEDSLGNRSSGFTTVATVTLTAAKPTLTAATPTIAGTAKVGVGLTAKTGTWTKGTTFAYTWLADGKAVAGATKSTFTPSASQAGKKLSVQVTGSLAGYASVSKTSAQTAVVAKGSLASTTPTIAGTPKVGAVLTAKRGTWTTGATFTYQWFAGGKAISGATKSTFTPTKTQIGKQLTVQITGTLSGYATLSKLSKQTTGVLK